MSKIVLNTQVLKNKKLLLATSGGVDSMVLLYLLWKQNLDVTAAHMNFNLRPVDCDKDARFIEEFCQERGIPFFIKSVNTKAFKKENKVSTQIAARDLRYRWFGELISQHHFDFLLTAHHLDDNIETFLMNVLRGSGVKGLRGIPNFQGNICRPLLGYSKEQIKNFAIENNIKWREDKSNRENDYLRNSLRNLVLPELEKIEKDYRSGFAKSLHYINEDFKMLEAYLKNLKQDLFYKNDFGYTISIEQLRKLKPLGSHIFHLFKGYGFTQPSEIIKLLDAKNSSEICNENYRLIKNREVLLLSNIVPEQKEIFRIELHEPITFPFRWKLHQSDREKSNFLANFDAEKVQLPLFLRKRKEGDFFYPVGMQGKKKISKFYKDLKFSKIEKEQTWLLTTAKDEIMWIVGQRLDRRFITNDNTKIWFNLEELV